MKLKTLRTVTGLLVMAAAAMALAIAVAPTNTWAQKKFDDVEITIATFPSTWEIRFREEVGPAMEEMGIKMKFIGGNSDAFLAQLIAAKGRTPFDVVEITDHVFSDLMAGEFLEKLDLANVPNTKFLNSSMYDDYRVGYWGTQAAMIWNWEAFEAQGIPNPEEIEDLLHPKLEGKVILPTLGTYNAVPFIVALAHQHGGSEADIDPALPSLRKFTKQVHSFTNFTPMSQAMKNGDIIAALSVGNGAIRILDAGIPMAIRHVTIQGKTGVPSFGYLGKVRGTEHPEAVEAFINAAIGWEMQEGAHVNNGIVPTHGEVLAKYAPQQRQDKFGTYFNIMEPEKINDMYYMDFSKMDRRAWGKKLQRVQAGK